MKIKLNQPYKSIATLAPNELPDFAVLIGRNGAGKTQLLTALKEGRAHVPGIAVDDIELYDMASFSSPDMSLGDRSFNQFAHATADAYLQASHRGRPPIETAEDVFAQFAREAESRSGVKGRDDFARNVTDEIRSLRDFAVFGSNRNPASPYAEALYEQVMRPFASRQSGRQAGGRSNFSFNGNKAVLLSTAMKLAEKLPHELTRDHILRASRYEGDTLSNVISQVFAAYKVDQFICTHIRLETESVGFARLVAEYRTKHPPPWYELRRILSEMRAAATDDGLFDFDFSDPDRHELNMGNYERFSFRAEMTNRTTGSKYDLGSLSSGEKVLMALCLSSFNQHLGRRRPKLLLLDELDAVLHPSMIEALATTLKSLFVSHGTKVLMTSHSPMTVAALDETDIFRVVRKNGRVDISRTTKSEAIDELSEGLATVDVGLRIAACDEAKVTILSEGHNALHLKKWVELTFHEGVRVFEGLPQHTNDNQLLSYGRLLSKMNLNTHFVIVWDCDAVGKAQELRNELPDAANVTPFAFRRREDNRITRKGIENNYEESILVPYSSKRTDHKGNLLGHDFRSDQKTKFANDILKDATVAFFTHFGELQSVVSRILGRRS